MLSLRLQWLTTPGRPKERRAAWIELAAVAGLLAIWLAVVYVRYVRSAGFVADDWATVASAHFADSTWSLLGDVFDQAGKRPGLVVYSVLTTRAFGTHGGAYVVFGMLWIGLSGITLYGLLRRIGLAPINAFAVPFLAVVFPACTSLHLWLANYYGNLALAAAFGGFLMAIAAFRPDRGRRARIALHVGAGVLFFVSAVTYEVTDALIALSGLIYLAAGIRPIPWKRWIADVAIVLFCAWAFTTNHLVSDQQAGLNDPRGLDVIRERAQLFADQTVTVFDRVIPFEGTHVWLPVLIVGLLLGAGIGAWRLGRRDDERRAQLGEAVALTGGGIVLIAVAYAVFVPADDFYAPAMVNIGDRINVLAMFGYVAVAYGTVLLAVRLFAMLLRPEGAPVRGGLPALTALAVLVVTILGFGAWYAHRTSDQIDLYLNSSRVQRDVVAAIAQDVPDHPDGTAIYAFDFPSEIAPQLPTYYANDLSSALRLKWNQQAVGGGPVRDLAQLACTATRVTEPVAGGAPYGPHTYFVSIADGRTLQITSQARCERAKSTLRAAYAVDEQGGGEGA